MRHLLQLPVDLLMRHVRPLVSKGARASKGTRETPGLALSNLFDTARRPRPSTLGDPARDGPPPSHHAIGGAHRLVISVPAKAADYLLVLRVEPSAPGCWLTVAVDGVARRNLLVNMRAVVCCQLTWTSIAGAPELEVSFDTSETPEPENGSLLRVLDVSLVEFAPPSPALRPSADLVTDAAPTVPGVPASDAELLSHFVSFGDNCEFGLFQRRHGVDGASLLRLAAVPFPGLSLALEERFAACYDPDELYFEILQYPGGRREYILKHQRYEIFWHTLVEEAEATPAKILVREYQKLCMLLRMLIESLATGNRIVVCKSNVALTADDCERLAGLLAPYGCNGLLVVVPARRRGDVGKVVVNGSGLMVGHIDKFLPYEAVNQRASTAWLTICRNAFESWRGRQAERASERTANASVDPVSQER